MALLNQPYLTDFSTKKGFFFLLLCENFIESKIMFGNRWTWDAYSCKLFLPQIFVLFVPYFVKWYLKFLKNLKHYLEGLNHSYFGSLINPIWLISQQKRDFFYFVRFSLVSKIMFGQVNLRCLFLQTACFYEMLILANCMFLPQIFVLLVPYFVKWYLKFLKI